uniref:Carbon starvation protein A n=1 Tax=Schlesneria paludicola TaxID=360056 RepID=A0A7C2P1S8_9PLAN
MSLLTVVLFSAVILTVAYFTYGPLLARLLQLNPAAKTPAVELRDDVDYVPLEPNALLSQHFSAIAAAGPIVGPILAGVMFGWLPALIWILVGSILIGGVHDISALVASIRHKARSIAEVVRDHMSRRAFVLFLSFVWFALVYIIVAFTDITAASFVGRQTLDNGEVVSGAGIASSSLMYLALPIIMGLLLRYTKLPLGLATIIFVPLVGVAIWAGQKVPFDLTAVVQTFVPGADDKLTHKVWDVLLLIYCAVASVVPMWLLLQPRGHLGGYFLYIALVGGMIGLVISSITGVEAIHYPPFLGWQTEKGATLFPILFITIACGACSGFHALIASGTTSKQLRVETDARLIGYGAMLLEGMVAIVSLCCVMRLVQTDALLKSTPNMIYATGLGAFLQSLGVSQSLAVSFALMAFTTFVYDTLDVCTRLGRYIIQELTGWYDAKGKWLGTILTGGAPVFFVMQTLKGPDGKEVELWRVFWQLFGASNQLLAALTLLGVTVWLWRTRRAWWVWPVFGLPTVWMYAMSIWALGGMIVTYWKLVTAEGTVQTVSYVLFGITTLLVVLALLMLIEAVLALLPQAPPSDDSRGTVPVTATA